jgi:probable F420-dependent oxidoreductase
VKIRIGYGLGVNSLTNDQERFGPFVDDLERLGYDSLWVSERIAGHSPDPVVAMAYAAGRTTNLKFGMSVMVLSGRNPVLVAKSMASLDRLSGGRLLPAFGLGAPNLAEWQAFGLDRKDRAPWFDEALPLMRRLWAEEDVSHHGGRFNFDNLNVLPKPVRRHLDVWLGGAAPSELRRVGRLADGWLPSFTTPAEVRSGIDVIKQVAAEHGREIEPDHYGTLVAYRRGPLSDSYIAAARARRPELDPTEIIPDGPAELRRRLEQFVEVGASKFVVIPVTEPTEWSAELEEVAEVVVAPLEA